MPGLAHAWLLQRPGITSPIVGPRTVEHLRTALETIDITLGADDIEAIDAIVPPGTWVSNYYYAMAYTRLVKAINHPTDPTAY